MARNVFHFQTEFGCAIELNSPILFIGETGPDKRGCLPVSCLHFLCGSDPIFRRVYTNHLLQVVYHVLSLTVLEGESSAEQVMGLVDGEEVQEDQAGLHYQGVVRLLGLKILLSVIPIYEFN